MISMMEDYLLNHAFSIISKIKSKSESVMDRQINTFLQSLQIRMERLSLVYGKIPTFGRNGSS